MSKPDSNSTIIKRGIAAIAAGVALGFAFNLMHAPDLKEIASEYSDDAFCSVAEDGSYIEIDTDPSDLGEYITSGSLDAIEHINDELGLPESVYAHMTSTRALDGMQSYEKDGVEVRWTYHPDNGLEIIYSVE